MIIAYTFCRSMKEDYLPGNKGELIINGKIYPIDTPQIIKYTSSYHVISHKLNLSVCSHELLMSVNFGASDKVDLAVLNPGHIFSVGKTGSSCFCDLMIFKENFSGNSKGGQIKVLENDPSCNLLRFEFIDMLLSGDNTECRINGWVSVIYERMEQKW